MTPRTILIGHPRSGTTLLRRLLGAHGQICAPPETHLFGACARFLHSQVTADGVDLGVLAGMEFAGVSEDEVLGRLRGVAFGLLDGLASADGKSHWVEKTAFDAFELDGIEKLCGDRVRYLGIIRHPLDVAVSSQDFCREAGTYPAVMHRYVTQYPQPIEAFCRSWLDVTESLVSLGQRRPGEVLICRYEDLVSEPEETVADVLDFIGVDNDTSFVAGALGRDDRIGFSDHKSYGVTDVHAESVGRWAKVPLAQQRRVATFLNPMLERCGYDPIDAGEALSVADARRRYVQSVALHAAGVSSPADA